MQHARTAWTATRVSHLYKRENGAWDYEVIDGIARNTELVVDAGMKGNLGGVHSWLQ